MSISTQDLSPITSIASAKQLAAALETFSETDSREIQRHYCLTSLYWLLWFGLGRKDLEHEFFFTRCSEVDADPNDRLDLWAREHGKSSIITVGRTIKDILNDPEITFGIFSHTRPIAKKFLRMIKREFETNGLLKELFPDVLWANPEKDSPKWSEDDGIVVRRKSNPGESTVEAWGLVDGQPTGKHFRVLVYDDVVTDKSVTTPDMIEKTTDCLALSYNLGSRGGARRFIGTRYHENDTYRQLIDRGTARVRLYPATADGSEGGEPVLLTLEELAQKRRDMGPYIFGAQMLQSPSSDKTQGFKREWMRFYKTSPISAGGGTNKYLMVDAANEKRRENDYTSMWVVGLAADANYYVLDIIRDRLNLTERADALFRLHKKWRPMQVRYEEYGLMGDIQHIQDRQNRENYRFHIVKVGGATPKNDRIRRLVPDFEQGRWYFPESLHYTDYEKKVRDLVHVFIEEEFAPFPVALHPDMLDSLARIAEPVTDKQPELALVWPQLQIEEKSDRYRKHEEDDTSAWAA